LLLTKGIPWWFCPFDNCWCHFFCLTYISDGCLRIFPKPKKKGIITRAQCRVHWTKKAEKYSIWVASFLIYKSFHLFQHSRLTNPTQGKENLFDLDVTLRRWQKVWLCPHQIRGMLFYFQRSTMGTICCQL
jgi:hypothetical protein